MEFHHEVGHISTVAGVCYGFGTVNGGCVVVGFVVSTFFKVCQQTGDKFRFAAFSVKFIFGTFVLQVITPELVPVLVVPLFVRYCYISFILTVVRHRTAFVLFEVWNLY